MESKLCASAAHITSKKLIDSGKINDVPVGSGPYIYEAKKSTRGSVYSFKKNSSYWDSKNYPYKTLEIRVIKSQTAAISALTASQIDGAMVSSSNLAKIQAAGLKTKSFSAKTTRLILSDHEGKKIPALGELKVRQAMNMVFDKDAMVKSLYSGHATVTDQVFRPKSDAYIDGLKDPYPFNVKKAKELMKEAGYEKGFSLELPTMEGQDHEVLMPYITEQLAKINITVKQVPLTGANAIGDLLSGDYPVVLWELGNLGNSAQQVQIEMTNTGYWNLSHQPDSYVDGRWEKLATASATESKKMQQEINQYVIDQAWFVPMVYAETFFAHSSRVAIPTSSDIEGISPKLRDFK
jgi:peptide/nickel transport system substrate-binding protein